MAEKRGNRSSKTAHVLNLLSHPTDTASEEKKESSASAAEEAVPASAQQEAAPQEQARLVPPILEVARANHIALEESIHSALEDALSDELPPERVPMAEPEIVPEPQPELTVETASIPEPQPEPTAETSSIPEPQPEPTAETASIPEPQPEPTAETASTPEPQPEPVDTGVLPDGSRLVNLMPEFVDEKLDKYMKMFQLCTCPRCRADAKALALTRLPSKYMVLPEHAYRPMMSFLESKFDSDVTAQVIYACKDVLANPRHTDEDLKYTE